MKLFDGTGFLIHRTRARVITAYLRGRAGAVCPAHRMDPLVPEGERALPVRPWRRPGWKGSPMRWRGRRSRHGFGTPWCASSLRVEQAFGPKHVLHAIAEAAAENPLRVVLEDVTFTELTFRRLMVGVDVLAGEWRRRSRGAGNSDRVGVLLPNVNGTPVTLLSLWAADRVPAILNFSTGVPVMLQCAQLAGLRQVITSRSFLEGPVESGRIHCGGNRVGVLGGRRASISGFTRLTRLLKHGLLRCRTSGGGSSGIRTPMVVRPWCCSPPDQRGIPRVELTMAICSPMPGRFLGSWTSPTMSGSSAPCRSSTVSGSWRGDRAVVPRLLHLPVSLAVALSGHPGGGVRQGLHGDVWDQHVPERVCAAGKSVRLQFREVPGGGRGKGAGGHREYLGAKKFGVRLMEGYGATECSPAICLNTRLDPRFGSVGRLPGMEWKLEPVDGSRRADGSWCADRMSCGAT